jgi:hypothetical protein
MPLRDHFHSPLHDMTAWESFHAGWPMVIVQGLSGHLPHHYCAEPRVQCGLLLEIDVATAEQDELDSPSLASDGNDSGVAPKVWAPDPPTGVWAPDPPTLDVATDLPAPDEYEVQVFDRKRGRRLVAAVEIVSPRNKDRPDHRRAFVAKCAALLQQHVSVTIVDLVTTRHFNLYSDLLKLIGQVPSPLASDQPLYAVACRGTKRGDKWLVETWAETLTLGQPLPTLPLWLADNLAVPLALEESYEETCRALRIP